MVNDAYLIIRVNDGRVSATTGTGGKSIDADVDFGVNDTRRKLVGLFERWMREGKITKRDELEALGTLLYEMIFPAAIGDFFLKKLGEFEARQKREPEMKDRRLRVELEISQPDLASLPWEFLFRPETESAKSFFLSSRTALVLSRLIPLEKDRPEMEACEELKVLVVDMLAPATSPPPGGSLPVVFKTLGDFLANQEERDARLGGQRPPRVAFKAEVLTLPNSEDFRTALHDFQPHVLHYLGQGSSVGTDANCISLRGDEGSTRWLANNEFADLFQDYQPKLVFLHLWQSPESAQANFANLAPALIRMDIHAVVALRYPLTLEAAQNFTKQFYQSLLNCQSVAAAVQEGRYWLSTNGRHSSVGSPVLFLQSMDGPIAALPAQPRLMATGSAKAYGAVQFAPMNAAAGAIPQGAGAMDASRTVQSASAASETAPNGSGTSPATRGAAPSPGDTGSSRRKEPDPAPGKDAPAGVNPLAARVQQLQPSDAGKSGD